MTYHRMKLDHASIKRAMRLSIVDGMFANASENMIGPFLALFALALGASKGQVGLLAAVPALLGNVLQIPAARLTERWGNRKLIILVSAAISRFLIILIILVPVIFQGDAAIYAFITLVTLRGLAGSIGVPGWTSIMADITPRRVRGNYFSARNILCSLTALGGTLLAGWLIRRYGFPAGYQLSMAVGAGIGILSLYTFSLIPVPPLEREQSPPGEKQRSLREKWQTVQQIFSRYPTFRNYCGTSILWNFAVFLAGPLVAVHYRSNLGGDPGFWGVVTAGNLVAVMIGQRYWGRLVDRFGSKNVMLVGGIGAVLVPFMWWVIPNYELAVLVNFIGGFCWGGYNLAAFNLILEITPERGRTMYIGIYNTVAGLASSIGPLVGGILADSWGLRPVLIASGILRAFAYIMFRHKVITSCRAKLHWTDVFPFWLRWRLQKKLVRHSIPTR